MKQSMAIPVPGLTGPARNTFGKTFWQTFGLTLGLAFAPVGVSMAEEPAPPARIGAFAKHVGNKIVYHYRVTNKSRLDITAVSIGYDTGNDNDPGNDVWELTELPSGWNPKLGIPAANSNSPTGWRVSMTTPSEESKTHAVTWEIINNKSPLIGSGQTMAKMSVAVDKADASYMTGHALVTFSDGPPAPVAKDSPKDPPKESPAAAETKSPPLNIAVPIEPLDKKPPTLAVTLTPSTISSPDSRHIPVNVTFATKEDDFDNLPEIKLESITANEPLEPDDIRDASYGLDDRHLRLRSSHGGSADRIYTVTYSATDASGNQTIASATVTVPATAPVAPGNPGETGKNEAK
jgi:hypothetical protein